MTCKQWLRSVGVDTSHREIPPKMAEWFSESFKDDPFLSNRDRILKAEEFSELEGLGVEGWCGVERWGRWILGASHRKDLMRDIALDNTFSENLRISAIQLNVLKRSELLTLACDPSQPVSVRAHAAKGVSNDVLYTMIMMDEYLPDEVRKIAIYRAPLNSSFMKRLVVDPRQSTYLRSVAIGELPYESQLRVTFALDPDQVDLLRESAISSCSIEVVHLALLRNTTTTVNTKILAINSYLFPEGNKDF